jgi:hypothetical protein
MILISGPAIGGLCLHTRKWAHEHMHRGSFGPVTRGPGYIEIAFLQHAARTESDRIQLLDAEAAKEKQAAVGLR